MTTMNTQQMETEIRAVKSGLKKANGLVKYLNGVVENRDKWVINMMIENKLYSKIMDYHIDHNIQIKIRVKTYIGDYTNKRGIVSRAHFHPYSERYMGSVKTLGEKEVDCDHYVQVDKTKHKWCVYTNKMVDI